MNKTIFIMTYLLLINLLLILGSCSHHSKKVGISNSAQDGLRFESLSRYNFERLKKISLKKPQIAACHKKGYNDALNSLKTTLDSDKNDAKYWNKIATCYLLKRELPKAKFYYDLALKTSGKDKRIKAIIYNNRGLYFHLRNLSDEALLSFNKSVELNNTFLTPKYNLAKIYLRFGHYQKARRILKRLIKVTPKDIDLLASLGHLLLMTGKYKQAKWHYSQISSQYLKEDSIATNYAMALFMLGEYKKAKNIISSADQSDSYYTLTQTKILKKIKYEKK